MKLDIKTIRQLGRLTDRMDLIRKHPHRYEIDESDMTELGAAALRVEEVLAKIRVIKAG